MDKSVNKAKQFKLSHRRQKEILFALASAAMKRVEVCDVIKMYETGNANWKHLFAGAPQEDEVIVFCEAIEIAKITDEEMDFLMEPFYAREIQNALSCGSQVKKVTIQW